MRRGLRRFKHEVFQGLDQSIDCLDTREVWVRLVAIEAATGIISVWLDDENNPIGIVISRMHT